MIDLHTHTIFSDGQLIPAELARRAECLGCRYIGLSDHMDSSNLDLIIPRIVQAAREINNHTQIKIIPAAELTHVPPPLIGPLAERARRLGAAYVVVHGESPVEPVAPGTNRAALEAGVEILAHPGLISKEDVRLAAEKNVLLEITARRGHSLTNGHVARLAKDTGAKLILNSDTHAPGDLIDLKQARLIALGAGLTEVDFEQMLSNAHNMIELCAPSYL